MMRKWKINGRKIGESCDIGKLAENLVEQPVIVGALFRNQATALIEHEQIRTTLAKSKELRRIVERLITLAKRGDLHARRQAAKMIFGTNLHDEEWPRQTCGFTKTL